MQGRNDTVHFVIDASALCIAQLWQSLVPQNTTLHELHHIKRTPYDRFVFTQHMHFGNGHCGVLQTLHDFEFTLDRMRRRQQFGNGARFGTHHIALRWRDEFVGRVRLPALEHLNRQRAFKTRQVLTQPCLQSRFIKLVRAAYSFSAFEIFVAAHLAKPFNGRLR